MSIRRTQWGDGQWGDGQWGAGPWRDGQWRDGPWLHLLAVVSVAVIASCGGASARAAAPRAASTSAPTASTAPATTSTSVPHDVIDLSGYPGVSAAEQHRAEALLRATIADIPKYDAVATAEAAGYRSIGDSITGDEHYVNWSYVDDGHILDPTRPESLVYEVRNGERRLVAAMYMMPFGSRFSDVPNVGGLLTQWHVHRDLCLTNDPVQKLVSSLTTLDGACPPGTVKAGNTPMLHVWIVPNACGPFAALEGVGAGQIADGATRLCDARHASVP